MDGRVGASKESIRSLRENARNAPKKRVEKEEDDLEEDWHLPRAQPSSLGMLTRTQRSATRLHIGYASGAKWFPCAPKKMVPGHFVPKANDKTQH